MATQTPGTLIVADTDLEEISMTFGEVPDTATPIQDMVVVRPVIYDMDGELTPFDNRDEY